MLKAEENVTMRGLTPKSDVTMRGLTPKSDAHADFLTINKKGTFIHIQKRTP